MNDIDVTFYLANFGIMLIAIGMFLTDHHAEGWIVVALQLNFLYNLTHE